MTNEQFNKSVTDSIKNLVTLNKAKDYDDLEQWIATTLVNDESSTDSELIEHFMQGDEVPYDQAKFYVDQRNKALLHGLTFTLESYKAKQDWPSVESQQEYWRVRDKDLDRIESQTQWIDNKANV